MENPVLFHTVMTTIETNAPAVLSRNSGGVPSRPSAAQSQATGPT